MKNQLNESIKKYQEILEQAEIDHIEVSKNKKFYSPKFYEIALETSQKFIDFLHKKIRKLQDLREELENIENPQPIPLFSYSVKYHLTNENETEIILEAQSKEAVIEHIKWKYGESLQSLEVNQINSEIKQANPPLRHKS